jgi:hypothetical protein
MFGKAKGRSNEDGPVISEEMLKRIKQAGLFEFSKYEIYNLYRFVYNIILYLEEAEKNFKL